MSSCDGVALFPPFQYCDNPLEVQAKVEPKNVPMQGLLYCMSRVSANAQRGSGRSIFTNLALVVAMSVRLSVCVSVFNFS